MYFWFLSPFTCVCIFGLSVSRSLLTMFVCVCKRVECCIIFVYFLDVCVCVSVFRVWRVRSVNNSTFRLVCHYFLTWILYLFDYISVTNTHRNMYIFLYFFVCFIFWRSWSILYSLFTYWNCPLYDLNSLILSVKLIPL